MAKRINDSGFAVIEALLIVVVLGIIGFTGWFVLHAKKNANASYDNASKVSQSQPLAKRKSLPATPSSNLHSQTDTSSIKQDAAPVQQAEPGKTFNFVDTSGWVERDSADKSYSVSLSTGLTYGYCNDVSGSILVGMIFLGSSNNYDCGGLKGAVTWQTEPGGATRLLTRVAFGPNESLWDRGDAKPVSVELPQKELANRYEYTNVINGKTYNTIEYTTTYKGKNYTALMHWDSGYDVYGSGGISPDVFDTIVQKTWQFK